MVDVLLEPITEPEAIQRLLDRTAGHEQRALVDTFGIDDAEARSLGEQAASNPRPSAQFFRILSNGSSVGWMWVDIVPTQSRGPEPWLLNIEIEADRRGRGLGRASIEALRDRLRTDGFSSLDLTVYGSNSTAENLYRSMQFRPMRTHLRLDL